MSLPGEDATCHVWDVEADKQISSEELPAGRRIYTRFPRALLQMPGDVEADESSHLASGDSEAFFTQNSMMLVEQEGGFKYQSLKADLNLEGPNGTRATVSSIVDSGAAWCAIRESTLENELPTLHSLMEPSRMRFHDASGRLMSLRGRIPLRIRLGSRLIETTAYVFKDLGAPFLLGANALMSNGCLIDCNLSRLYVHDDPALGVPMTSATCVSCEVGMCTKSTRPEWQRCIQCPSPKGRPAKLVCDRDGKCVNLLSDDDEHAVIASVVCTPATIEASAKSPARLTLDQCVTIEPGTTVILDPKLEGVAHGTLSAIEMEITPELLNSGLEIPFPSAFQNPTNSSGSLRTL